MLLLILCDWFLRKSPLNHTIYGVNTLSERRGLKPSVNVSLKDLFIIKPLIEVISLYFDPSIEGLLRFDIYVLGQKL